MKRKILMFLICGVIVLGLTTGCGNDKKQSDEKNNSSNNNNVKEVAKKISDWDKNRVGDSLTSDDGVYENVIYKLEKLESGDYVLYVKNNNDYGINLFATLKFYFSSDEMDTGIREEHISCLKAKGVGAIILKDITREYIDYKLQLRVEKKDFVDGSKYIDFEESIKDNKLKINAVNNYDDEIKGLVVTVLYYKNNKVVSYETADVGYGRYIIVTDYPKNKNGDKVDYDKYEIYLNTAYISQ